MIVLCDLCNAATHQSCYGGSLLNGVPSGNWYCDRCTVLMMERTKICTEIKCILCPEYSGLMKCIDIKKQTWAHVICVNWNPDVYFNDDTKSSIGG
jgi:NuA3 HAT complex component NTO1